MAKSKTNSKQNSDDGEGSWPAEDDSAAIPSKDELRRQQIARAAYYRAERRNFQGDGELDDWLEAEREIDSLAASAGTQGEASKLSEAPQDLSTDALNESSVADAREIEPDDIKQWADTFAVSRERLRLAIERVGTRVADVERSLRDNPSA